MTIQILADVTCDICGRTEEIVIEKLGYAHTELEIKLRNLGWFYEGDAHYCGDCKECDDEE